MKRLLIVLLLPLLAGTSIAQTSVWKVKKGKNEMYLAGSIHVLKKSDYPLPAEFDQAFANSDKLVFETDIAKLKDPSIAQMMMSKAMLADGKTLSDVLSEETYKALEAETAKLSLPLSALAQFKPSMVMVTLTGMKLQQLGISSEGVDQFYYSKAQEAGKGLGYLETIESQIDVLMNMGQGNEDEFVKYSISDLEETESAMSEMVSNWRSGKSTLFEEQLSEMKDDYKDTYQSLMVNRNNAWMPHLEEFMKDEVTEFVVVGTLHLHGEDGLLDMLEAKGYKIKQVK